MTKIRSINGYEVYDEYARTQINALQSRAAIAGMIYPFAGTTVPEGFLMCDGAEYSRTAYPELFAAIGTTYGAGDGTSTFNVPDLQTRVPVGAGGAYTLGDKGGEATHKLTIDEMPSHSHPEQRTITTTTSQTDGYIVTGGYNANGKISGSGLQGNDQPHNNMQPYTVVNYVISTGKGSSVNVVEVIDGIQTLPLAVEYGGTGASTVEGILEKLGLTANSLGITTGTAEAPATGEPNSIYIQMI